MKNKGRCKTFAVVMSMILAAETPMMANIVGAQEQVAVAENGGVTEDATTEIQSTGEETKELSGDAAAVHGTCGMNATWTYDAATYTLTISGTGPVTEEIKDPTVQILARSVVVAKGINSLPVGAFDEWQSLEDITILGDLTDNNLFYYSDEDDESENTVTLKLGGKCEVMGWMLLYGGRVELLEGNPYYIEKDKMVLSKDKTHLYYCQSKSESVKVPDTVKVIERGAISFKRNVVLGKNVRRIKRYGIFYCGFSKKLKLPKKLKRIDAGGFARSDMDGIVLNKKLRYIGAGAFDDTGKMKIVIDHKIDIRETNFPGSALVFRKGAKQTTSIYWAYYWPNGSGTGKVWATFLNVSGADGYQIKLTQPGQKVRKVYNISSKHVKYKAANNKLRDENSVVVTKAFAPESVENVANGYRYQYRDGYDIYVSVRPYKIKNKKKVYGRWSAATKTGIDMDGTWVNSKH